MIIYPEHLPHSSALCRGAAAFIPSIVEGLPSASGLGAGGSQRGWQRYIVRGTSPFGHFPTSQAGVAMRAAYSVQAGSPLDHIQGKGTAEAKLMPLKIMAVDDEPAGLKLMRSLVVPLGHNIQTFDDSEEAGQLAEEERFDVVFVGLRMADPDGFELTRRIRNSEPNRETPIVMLSGTDDVETLRRAFGEGATFVLPKPVPAARIIPMLAALESPWWKFKKRASRLPFFTEVHCKCGGRHFALRSMNISETGMLLQPWVDIDEGEEVSLEFKITEVRASLSVRARVVRKDGTERVGVEFVGLAPEDLNAIQLYVMGHLKEQTRGRDLSGMGMNRLLSPKD